MVMNYQRPYNTVNPLIIGAAVGFQVVLCCLEFVTGRLCSVVFVTDGLCSLELVTDRLCSVELFTDCALWN